MKGKWKENISEKTSEGFRVSKEIRQGESGNYQNGRKVHNSQMFHSWTPNKQTGFSFGTTKIQRVGSHAMSLYYC